MMNVRLFATSVLLLLASLTLGCGRATPSPNRPYGYSTGREGTREINGYGAFRKMFQGRGHKTFASSSLSKSLQSIDTIVWTPDTQTPPSIVCRDFIEQWLTAKSDRTLVYIGRDFDASIDYWQAVVDAQPLGKQTIARREQMLARVQSMESDLGGVHFARWFTVDATRPRSTLGGLRGELAEGIDSSKTRLSMRTELRPAEYDSIEDNKSSPAKLGSPTPANKNTPWSQSKERWTPEEISVFDNDELERIPDAKILLSADDGRPLVFELTSSPWGTSKIIVIANGCFTLNGALVIPEHRKLAARIIDRCTKDGKVTFLRSDRNGPPIRETEDSPYSTQGLEMFAYWPMNLVVYHFFFLGIVICFVAFPIFGRPRTLPERDLNDFGQHIEALGGMLIRTKDEQFARERISDYFRLVRREPKHPWCIAPMPKAPIISNTLQPTQLFDTTVPIEAEIITAQIEEKKS
jgi:hypothetical protein